MDDLRESVHTVTNTADSALSAINATRNLMVVYVLLTFFGFPGNLSIIIGGSSAKLLEYLSWGMQFVLVMLASGDDVWNLKLLNLQPSYWVIYLFLTYMCVDSLLMVSSKKTVAITLIHMALTVMFALWLVEQFESETMMELFYFAQLVYVAICVVCIVLFHRVVFYRYQGADTFCGLFGSKNEAATELSLGILVQCILLRFRLRRSEQVSILFLGVMLLQFGLMLLCKAAGAIIITIVYIGYIVFYGLSENKKRLPLGLIFVAVTIAFLVFALTILQALEPLFESIGKDASLTGRVPIWEKLIAVMTESRTLTGYGAEMFWKTPEALKAFRAGLNPYGWAYNHASNSHNTMMEIWCNLGLIGVVLYYFMFLRAGSGIKYLGEEDYLFSSSFIVLFTVRALTERQTAPASVYVFISYVVLAMQYQAKYKHKQSLKRKARVFNPEEATEKRTLTVSSGDELDWTAFQSRFSNQADNVSGKKNTPFSWDEAPVENDKSNLEKLLQEFDDD